MGPMAAMYARSLPLNGMKLALMYVDAGVPAGRRKSSEYRWKGTCFRENIWVHEDTLIAQFNT